MPKKAKNDLIEECLRVDHLVYGVPGRLDDAAADFERRTGVKPLVGGAHPNLGTHNCLVALGGGAYFEILTRDPAQPDPPRLWMGMESLEGPTMLTWATWCDRGGEMAATVSKARGAGSHLRALGIEPSDMQLRQGPADRLVATLSTPRGLVEF